MIKIGLTKQEYKEHLYSKYRETDLERDQVLRDIDDMLPYEAGVVERHDNGGVSAEVHIPSSYAEGLEEKLAELDEELESITLELDKYGW